MRRNSPKIILWGLAILAIPLFVLAATTSKKINSSGYTKTQGYFPIATLDISSFQDPASVGSYPGTIHGYPYTSPNAADPQYERVLITARWIPRATWTTTVITGPRLICTRGYNGTSAKECVPNKSVSIKFKTDYNTLTNTPNPTSTLTPVPPTATDTPNGTQTLVNTEIVATCSPTLTHTPTHINSGNGVSITWDGSIKVPTTTTGGDIKMSSDGEIWSNTVKDSSGNVKNLFYDVGSDLLTVGDGSSSRPSIAIGYGINERSITLSSLNAPVTGYNFVLTGNAKTKFDNDGGNEFWVSSAAGAKDAWRVYDSTEERFDANWCVNVEATTTQTPGYNDAKGLNLANGAGVHGLPTPAASWDAVNKAYLDAYVDYNPIQKSLTSSKGLLIGDSIMVETAATPVIGSMDSYLLTNSDSLLGTTCYNQSVAGQGIAEQKAIWVSDANKATYDWIIIQVGINNLVTPSEAATEVIADYQDFVDTINAGKKSTCALLASTLSPDYSVLVDLLGNTAGAAAYQKWLDVNEAIGGGGSTPVTGVHVHITEISDALNDGNGNLAYKYSYDGIHPNEAGRKVMAGIYRKHLNRLGFLANGSLIDKSGNPPMVSPVSMTVAQRDNLPAATIGDVVYNSTSKTLDYLFGDGWKSAGSIIKSATVTGPNPVEVGLDVDVAYCDTSAGSFVYRLPLATGSGRVITFKKTNNDTNFVSVWADTTGTPDLIDGQAAIGLTTQYETLQIQDGAVNNWYTLSHDFCSIVPPPMATETPVAGDLVRKEYVDAGVNAVATPAIYAYEVANAHNLLLAAPHATATPLASQFPRRDTLDVYYSIISTPAYRYDTVATPVVAIATAWPAVATQVQDLKAWALLATPAYK